MAEPRDITMHAEPAVIRLTPYGFHRYASEFLEAGMTPVGGGGYSPVPYYCTCRALELGLKSFLLARGIPIADLKRKRYGHNLDALLVAAESHDIREFWQPSADDVRHIHIANAMYSNKDFEYFTVIQAVRGRRDLPDLAQLRLVAAALLAATKQYVLELA